MNLDWLLKRLLGRPTCRLGEGARLLASARILNAQASSDRICIGAHSVIGGELFVFRHGGSINIGDWSFVGPGTRIWSAAEVHVGHRVMISHGVSVFDSLTHPIGARARHEQFRCIAKQGHPDRIDLGERTVRIESDAWIGAGAIVLRGVTIGQGAIVGAGSVVTRDVPPSTICVGNPAQVLRALTAEEVAG